MCSLSDVRQLVEGPLQPFAQVPHRLVLAGQERVDVHAGPGRHLLETPALDLMRHEYRALLFRKFAECPLQLLAEPPPGVLGVWAGVSGRQQVLDRQQLSASPSRAGSRRRARSMMRLRATRNSQPLTWSIGISRRLASTSSKKTSWTISSTSAALGTRRRTKFRSRARSRSTMSAMRWSGCRAIHCSACSHLTVVVDGLGGRILRNNE
jgi:hypothetical protein